MADRAARFARRPPSPAEDAAARPERPDTSMAERAARMGRFHRERETTGGERPKPLDMADLAARTRQTREVAKPQADEPVAAPAPAAEPATAPRPALSMAERAARHTLARRVALEDAALPAAAAPRPAPAAPAPVPTAAAPAAEEPSMAERAAEAVRRKREAGGPAQAGVGESLPAAEAAVLGSLAFVVASRNDAGHLAEHLQAWRRIVDRIDARWFQLDLGSTDESVAVGENAQARVVFRPGGLVEPLDALTATLRQCQAEIVVVADAAAAPDAVVVRLIEAVRAGSPVAAAPAGRPSVLALARKPWLDGGGFGRAPDLQTWAEGRGGVAWLSGGEPGAVDGFVARGLTGRKLDTWWRRAREVVAKAAALARQLRG